MNGMDSWIYGSFVQIYKHTQPLTFFQAWKRDDKKHIFRCQSIQLEVGIPCSINHKMEFSQKDARESKKKVIPKQQPITNGTNQTIDDNRLSAYIGAGISHQFYVFIRSF